MQSGPDFIVKGSAVCIKYYTYSIWSCLKVKVKLLSAALTDFLVVVVGWLSMAQLLLEIVTTLFLFDFINIL